MILQKVNNSKNVSGTKVDYDFVMDCLLDGAIESPWICGGKSTYQSFISDITEFYVTHIDKEYDGDTFMFPFEHLYNKQELIKEFDFGKIIKYST
jgi:dihydrofolate reductase